MSLEGYAVIAARIRHELDEVAQVLRRVQAARGDLDDEPPGRAGFLVDSMALGLHGCYSGLERLFEEIASSVDRAVPTGPAWRRELLEQMALDIHGTRPPVLDGAVHRDLDELLRFRHRIRNVYSVELDADKVLEVAEAADRAIPAVREQLLQFAEFLDETAHPGNR